MSVGGRLYSIGVDECNTARTQSAEQDDAANEAAAQGLLIDPTAAAVLAFASLSLAAVSSNPGRPRAGGALGGHTSATGVGTAGLAGLGLSYALPIVGSLQGLIGSFTETEKEFVSIERQSEYVDVAEEDEMLKLAVVSASTSGSGVPAASHVPGGGTVLPGIGNWPSRGELVFQQVTARYPGASLPAVRGV